MILDANDYRARIPYVEGLVKDKDEQEIYDFIGIISVATGIPIIVVVYYIMELYGYTSQLYAFAIRLQTFYTVTKVLNIKEELQKDIVDKNHQLRDT